MPNSHDDKYDLNHFRRVESYAKQVENLYKALIKDISGLSSSVKYNPEKPFSYSDYPAFQKKVDKLFLTFAQTIRTKLQNNNQKEWKLAEEKAASLVDSVAQKTTLPKAVISEYKKHNLTALNAFQNRKSDGLKLSDRVWKYTDQFKKEIELGLDLGLGEGKSAAELSRDLRSYLNDPDKLFRRVRDKHGNLHLSKNAENYHPGQGVYRSSYKNAMRLTRTENNIAYHEAMSEKYNQFDFVIGIEVRLSNNPNHCPFCSEMAGKYPKDFKFWGWHPMCRCTTIPILKTWEEMEADNEKLILAKPISESPDLILQPNERFMNWARENKGKIETSRTKPFFVQNNEKYIQQAFHPQTKTVSKPKSLHLYSDPLLIKTFTDLVIDFGKKIPVSVRKNKFQNLIKSEGIIKYSDDVFVLEGAAPNLTEIQSAAKLAKAGNYVIFPSDGAIKKLKEELKDKTLKKNDIYFYDKKTFFQTKADLKTLSDVDDVTIARHISKGGKQAPVIVMDFERKIDRRNLINGLRSGWDKDNLKKVLIYWKGEWKTVYYSEIHTNNIYDKFK